MRFIHFLRDRSLERKKKSAEGQFSTVRALSAPIQRLFGTASSWELEEQDGDQILREGRNPSDVSGPPETPVWETLASLKMQRVSKWE